MNQMIIYILSVNIFSIISVLGVDLFFKSNWKIFIHLNLFYTNHKKSKIV